MDEIPECVNKKFIRLLEDGENKEPFIGLKGLWEYMP